MKQKNIWLGLIALLLIIQFIPLNQTNPTVIREPAWDSPRTRAYAQRACFDCHSNETVWPWYAHVAPLSWLITNHVNEGRKEFNISEWKPGQGDEAAEHFRDGEMPLSSYRLLHPEARLSATERSEFLEGLIATFGQAQEGDHGDEEDDD